MAIVEIAPQGRSLLSLVNSEGCHRDQKIPSAISGRQARHPPDWKTSHFKLSQAMVKKPESESSRACFASEDFISVWSSEADAGASVKKNTEKKSYCFILIFCNQTITATQLNRPDKLMIRTPTNPNQSGKPVCPHWPDHSRAQITICANSSQSL